MKSSLRRWIALTLILVLLGAPAGLRPGSALLLGAARADNADAPEGCATSSDPLPSDENAPEGGDAAIDETPSEADPADGGDSSPNGAAENPDADVQPDSGAQNSGGEVQTDADVSNPCVDAQLDGGAENPGEETMPDDGAANTDGAAANTDGDVPPDGGAANSSGETQPDDSAQPAETPDTPCPGAEEPASIASKASLTTEVLIGGAATSEALINLNASAKVLRLTAQVKPSEALQAVIWKTSNKKVAKISAKGLICTVTGLKAGTATITATAADGSGKSAQVVVTVAALSKKVTISGAISLVAGSTTTLKAAVSPKNTTNKKVLWSSGDESIATVDLNGIVTAKSVTARGTVTITATAADSSGAFDTHVITVYPRATGVLIGGTENSEARIDLNTASKSLRLTAQVVPSDALQAMVWKTSNKKSATISAKGLNCTVTGLKAGTATITATATDGSGKSAQVVVTVAALAKKVTVSGASELIAGASTTLNASVSPKDTTNKSVLWSSGDESTATVDSRGVVTAANIPDLRTVTITATAADGGGASGTHAIRVYPASTGVQILQNGVAATEGTIYLGVKDKTLLLTAVVTPPNAKPGATWTIDNGKIAKLSPSSANCKVTGLKAGVTTIRATAADGRVSAAFALTVANGKPSAVIRSITAEKRMIQRSERASWTVDATGYGNLTYTYEILRNSQVIPGAVPDFPDGKVAYYQTDEGGVYSLRVTLTDAAGSMAVSTGGDVTVCEMNLSQAPDEIPVSGMPSGYYATFGPDITPPAGVTIRYSLNIRIGPRDALILGYALNESCRVDYTARSLGHVQAELTYNAFDGEWALFSGAKNIEFDLVKETDLPTAIRVEPAEISGVPGEEVWIPEDHIVLTGGKLIPSNLSYTMRDASGAVVGNRLSVTFDAPGRYTITLTGEYFDEEWTCPVTFAIDATDCTLEVYKGFGTAYLDGVPSGNFAHVAVLGANLAEGETASWGLERVDGGTSDPPITLYLANPDKYGVTINFRDVVSIGTVRHRLTYEAAGGLYSAEREFTVTVESAVPGNLPTGCVYPTREIHLAPGDTQSFETSLITFTGGEEPAGAWRGFGPGGNVWAHADVSPRSDGMDITFRDAGRYIVDANAGVGNISFVYPIVVVVEDAEHPALKLMQEFACQELYQDGAEEGYLGRVFAENLALDDGADSDWSIEPVGGSDQPAEIAIGDSDAWSANLSFHLNGGAGQVQYRVTLTVGALTASTVVSVNVAEAAPPDFPSGIQTPYDAKYQIHTGDSLTFEKGDITFERGGEPDGAWKDVWQGDGDWDNVGWEWADEVLTATFPDPGRYFVTLVVGVSNIRFTQDVEIVVSDEPAYHLRVDVDPGLIYTVLYTGGEQKALLGYASAPDAVVHGGAGESCDWTLEKTGGTGDPIALTLTKDGVAGAFLNYALSGEPGTAEYHLTYRAAGVYYGECSFTVTVLDGPPTTLPSGISSPFDALYRVDVGGSLSFDPAGIQFETAGDVPEGMPVWKAVWPLSGDWYKIQNTWEGDVRHVAFVDAGRFFFRAVIGLGNVYYWKDIEVIASDDIHEPLEAEIGLNQRFKTAYLDGEWEQHLGNAWPEGVILRDGEDFHWTLTRIEGAGVADVWLEDERADHAELVYRLQGGTGAVKYLLSYTAAGGLYRGEREIVLQVASGTPEGLPTVITTPYESLYKIRPGDSLTFDTDAFQFANPGVIPEGEEVLRQFWDDRGDWNSVDESWDEGVVTKTFPNAGLYTAHLALGVSNFFYKQDITILVSGEEDYHLDVSLGLNQRFETAYLGGEHEQYLGDAWVENGDMAGAVGDDFQWTLTTIEGADIANLSLEWRNPYAAGLHYELPGGTGAARYRLSYSALGGLVRGEREIALTVAPGTPEGLPSGVTTPYESLYKLRPGESLTFDTGAFQFANPGNIPDGETVLREFWDNHGDWNAVEKNWDGGAVTMTFPNAGLYTAYLTVGVCNFYYTQEVRFVVSAEEDSHLNVEIGFDQRFHTAYLGGTPDQFLGRAWVENDEVSNAADEDYQWTLTPIEGGDAAALSIDGDDAFGADIFYELPGGTGAVRYNLTYTAVNGLVRGEREIALEVAPGTLEGLPSGITTPYDSLYKLRPGASLTFDTGEFQFAQPGVIPEGETVLRQFWYDDGYWDKVDSDWDGGAVTLTFPDEGVFTAHLTVGVCNFFYLQDITVIVSENEDYHLDLDFELHQSMHTAYLDGATEQNLGYARLEGDGVPESVGDDFEWTLTPLEGAGAAVLSLDGQDLQQADIHYVLPGGTGTARYLLRYTAAGGQYLAETEIALTVASESPETLPSGIATPYDAQYILNPGDSMSFDFRQFDFMQPGEIPEGEEVYRDFWEYGGGWDNVDMDWDHDGIALTFPEQGRYTARLVIGICNHFYPRDVEFVVGDAAPLDPDLSLNLRYTTLYVGGSAYSWMGNVSAYGAALDEGDDYHWSVEKTGGTGDPVGIELEDSSAHLTHVAYTLKGGTGTASYLVTYTAADGKYQAERAFTLTVAENPAAPFPSGILTPFEDVYEIDAGTKLSFDTSLIGFTSDGEVPEGASVYRNVYDGAGDWSQVDTTIFGGVRESTFRGAGYYTLEVEVGINNMIYRKWIEVTVKDPTFSYSLNPDGKTITITGYTGSASELDVPAQIDGHAVTGIGDWAFFGNKVLTSVDLPDSVTHIGANAFRECSLAAIDLPDGLTSLGESAFQESGLATIDLPDGITSIADRTFYLCISLREVDLPDGLTSIGHSAFGECWMLQTIDLPDGVTSLGGKAFYFCFSLTAVHLPNGLTSIGYCTFCYCRSLTSIDLPDGLTSIGYYAFGECRLLAEVDFPDGLTWLDAMAFDGCPSLTAIDLPDGLTSIGDHAFAACTSLTAVDLPDGLTSMGGSAFAGCTSLTAINLPDGLTSIGDAAFGACYALRQASIGTQLSLFSMRVFSESENLESIIIHAQDVMITDLDLIGGFPNLTFYVWDGSVAEEFMQDHNLRYDLIESMRVA